MEEQESLIKPEKKIKVSHCIRPCWHKSYSLSQKIFFPPLPGSLLHRDNITSEVIGHLSKQF